MDGGTASISGGWSGIAMTVVTVVLVGVFHRLRDRRVLAGDARAVFSPGLAGVYLAGVALFWVVQVAALGWLAVTGRTSASTSEPLVVLPGLLAVAGYVVLVVLVWRRVGRADPELTGPVAQLGRYIRVAYGSAAPAAWRRLRASA
ncbi:hypothetical protein [Modestobacter roseus]|uniref:Uncharacterized protein n=1 Tax=Modestobacter roseus TaxID=1181884 RepID=A0A562IR39_9ACTN|nr:hypothetical protein [Modestobacter roseus]MQA31998.1 hypothetical protein [Modestobacter roseus]TWH73471.1 hypothetical protein JD78_01994 [Modestobacter roseus]